MYLIKKRDVAIVGVVFAFVGWVIFLFFAANMQVHRFPWRVQLWVAGPYLLVGIIVMLMVKTEFTLQEWKKRHSELIAEYHGVNGRNKRNIEFFEKYVDYSDVQKKVAANLKSSAEAHIRALEWMEAFENTGLAGLKSAGRAFGGKTYEEVRQALKDDVAKTRNEFLILYGTIQDSRPNERWAPIPKEGLDSYVRERKHGLVAK